MSDAVMEAFAICFAGGASFLIAFRISIWCSTKLAGYILKKMGII